MYQQSIIAVLKLLSVADVFPQRPQEVWTLLQIERERGDAEKYKTKKVNR